MRLEEYAIEIKTLTDERGDVQARYTRINQLERELTGAAWSASHASQASQLAGEAAVLLEWLGALCTAHHGVFYYRRESGGVVSRHVTADELERWPRMSSDCRMAIKNSETGATVDLHTDLEFGGHVVMETLPFRQQWIDHGKDFKAALIFAAAVVNEGWEAASYKED